MIEAALATSSGMKIRSPAAALRPSPTKTPKAVSVLVRSMGKPPRASVAPGTARRSRPSSTRPSRPRATLQGRRRGRPCRRGARRTGPMQRAGASSPRCRPLPPTATASVGDTSNAIAASVVSAISRKIAGKTAPPRKPQPRQTAYASAFAASSTRTTRPESSVTRPGIDALPENSTSCEFAPSPSARSAKAPAASPPPTSSTGTPSRARPGPATSDATRRTTSTRSAIKTPAPTAMTRSRRCTPS